MARRRTIEPDHRFDWRDPNMPVLREYRMPNGDLQTHVEPEYEHRYREHMMTAGSVPHYTNDPTYNLRKLRK